MAHIIYIDDSKVELAAVANALQLAGHEVTTGTTARSVEHQLQRAEIVLIDFHMPGANGEEVLGRLRERSNDPSYYIYTSDKLCGANYHELGFDGRIILKGNHSALVRQVASALRIRALRSRKQRRARA